MTTTPPVPKCAEFRSFDEARAWQASYGGHIFLADSGEAFWFDIARYRVTDVFMHRLTLGIDGILNPKVTTDQ